MAEQMVETNLELAAIREAYQRRAAETQAEIGQALADAADAKSERDQMADVLTKALQEHAKELQDLRERFEADLSRLSNERDAALQHRAESRDRHIAELQHVLEELAGVRVVAHSLDQRAEGVLTSVAKQLRELQGA